MSDALSPQRQAWQGLLDQPLRFVNPRYLRQCWPAQLTDEQYKAVSSTSRLQSRRAELLRAHFKLRPLEQTPPVAEQDLSVLLLSPQAFEQLPRRCGAIWHAATLSREIRSEAVNQLRNMLGHEVFAMALAHRQLASAVDLLRQPADLLAAIDRDGAGLVSTWLQSQPPELRDWLHLRLTFAQVPPASGTQASGAQPDVAVLDIVRHAAATFSAAAEEVA